MSEPTEEGREGTLDRPVTRRGLLKYVLLGFSAVATAAGTLTPVVAYLWPPRREGSQSGERVAVASTGDLPVGTGQVFSVNNKPVLVVHAEEGFKALSAVCTHLGCIVAWNEQRNVIACPCHEAFFNLNGAVISGPPPGPLPAYRVQVEGDQVYVEGAES